MNNLLRAVLILAIGVTAASAAFYLYTEARYTERLTETIECYPCEGH